MPRTATKGTRSKFYNELARDARQLDSIRIPATFSDSYFPSGNASRAEGSQLNYQPVGLDRSTGKGSIRREEEEDDDGGWGSIPSSTRGGNPTRSEKALPHHSNTDRSQRSEDRAHRVAKNDLNNNPIHTNRSSRNIRRLPDENTHRHTPTPTSKEKVKSWISSSRDITPRNTLINPINPSASSSFPSRSTSGKTGQTPPRLNPPYPKTAVGKREDKMNYLQEDLPGLSSSYRRYLPPDPTDPYRTINNLPDTRHQTFSPRILENARLRSPLSLSNLHPTNPFSGTNLPSYRGREGETMNASNNAEIMEKERQAALQRAQELQRRIEDNKRAQGIPQRAGDNQEIRTLQHEIDHLQTKVREYRDISLAHQNRIHELETQNTQVHASHPIHQHTHNDNSASLMGEVIELKSEIDRLNREISDLTGMLHSTDKELEEERGKRLKLELEAESSKKGQSSTAKLLDTSENKVKNLENLLKESQERERLARVGQSAMEKKVKGFDHEKLMIQKDLETWRSKAMIAYREKEGAIAKYRGKEHDNAKLSDKLNLSRREKEALQARLDEVLNEVAQSAEKSEFEKASLVDRRKIKEELLRERATSDRLRNERNTYREQLKALKIQLHSHARGSTKPKSSETTKSTGISSTLSELHHPTPTSPDKHRPKFSLDPLAPVTHSTNKAAEDVRKEGGHEVDEDGDTVEEVIEDTDGTEYTSQRVILQDGLSSVDVHQSEISRSNDITPRNDNTTSNYTSDIQSLLPPKLTMASLPLQPRKKVDTPSKEEISLFSPSTSASLVRSKLSEISSYDLNVSDTNSTIRPGDSISNIYKNKDKGKDKDEDEEEKRRKWLTRYAELSDLKDDSSLNRMIDTSRVDSMDEKVEKVIVDPFADLDPLDSSHQKSFSPNSSSAFSPKTSSSNITTTSEAEFRSQPQEQIKKANQQSLMDLLSSPLRY